MGCDIHVYIEYKRKGQDKRWHGFTKRINPGRNYFMFGILAGVRCDTSFSFEPKGMPENFGSDVHEDYLIYISEDEVGGRYVNLEKAQRYASYGQKIINGSDGSPCWVEAPDWHTHSWLTTEEYRKAIDFYKSQPDSGKYPEPEYEAILAAMETFERMGFDSRIVFWFDN